MLSFLIITILCSLPNILLILFSLQQQPITAKKFFAGFHCGGHRGSPRIAPENTIESFEKAKQSNVDLIEFDLSLTKDAVAIIMHDDDLERTCAEKTPVSALLAHEIVTKNAAKNFKFADGKQKICPVPTLEQTVKYGRDSNLKMLFDVKDGSKEMISQIVNVISKNNLYDQVIVSSFFAWVPYAVKKADPKILTGVTWRPYFFSYSDIENKHPRFTGLKHYLAVLLDWINVKMIHSFLPQFVGAEMVLTQERDINGCFVDDMEKKNIQVVAWTVNDQRQMMHFVDTLKVPILTDVPHKFSRLSSLRSELNALSKEPDTFDNSDSSKYKASK